MARSRLCIVALLVAFMCIPTSHAQAPWLSIDATLTGVGTDGLLGPGPDPSHLTYTITIEAHTIASCEQDVALSLDWTPPATMETADMVDWANLTVEHPSSRTGPMDHRQTFNVTGRVRANPSSPAFSVHSFMLRANATANEGGDCHLNSSGRWGNDNVAIDWNPGIRFGPSWEPATIVRPGDQFSQALEILNVGNAPMRIHLDFKPHGSWNGTIDHPLWMELPWSGSQRETTTMIASGVAPFEPGIHRFHVEATVHYNGTKTPLRDVAPVGFSTTFELAVDWHPIPIPGFVAACMAVGLGLLVRRGRRGNQAH